MQLINWVKKISMVSLFRVILVLSSDSTDLSYFLNILYTFDKWRVYLLQLIDSSMELSAKNIIP